MSRLTVEPEEYLELQEAFQGGFTHANARKVGKVIEKVTSYDFTSSYPTVMIAEKFPMGKGVYHGSVELNKLKELSRRNCCMFRVKFETIVPIVDYDHPLSYSKCRQIKNAQTDNGRIVSADYLETTLTEQDFFVLEKFYEWDSIEIFDLIAYPKGYLPTPFVKSVLDLYKQKTELKDVEGEEVNYMISKNMLNSCYGMTVTDIVRDAFEYVDDEYIKLRGDVDEQIMKYNKNIRRFLFYPWGVWITAYARANLFSGIYSCGKDYIYADTDSIKITNAGLHLEYISKYNEEITRKLQKAFEYHGFDFSDTKPKNKWGKEKPIGVWDNDGVYDKFKTLGAKRYLTQRGNKWSLTVAGLHKKEAMNYLLKNWSELGTNPFKQFNTDLVVPSRYSGRNTLTYIDDEMRGVGMDYLGNRYEFHELSGIHMESSEYSMSAPDNFIEYLLTIWDESY